MKKRQAGHRDIDRAGYDIVVVNSAFQRPCLQIAHQCWLADASTQMHGVMSSTISCAAVTRQRVVEHVQTLL
jgi:hypothetical protein